MNSFPERLSTLISTLDLNQTTFAQKIDFRVQTINRYTSNKSSPGLEFFQKLTSKYPHININWLVTGQGQILETSLLPEGSLYFDSESYKLADEYYQGYIKEKSVEKFQNHLLNIMLEESLFAIYKDFKLEKAFWNTWINSNRNEIVSLVLLQKILKVAVNKGKREVVQKKDAKNVLITIFKDYTITFRTKVKHLISDNDKKIIIENLEKNLTDKDAYHILQNMPAVLEKITSHLETERKVFNS